MKKKWNSVLFIVLIVVTFLTIYTKIDIKLFENALLNANIKFLVLGLICMFVYWGIEAGLIDMLIKKVSPKTKFWTSIKTTVIGQYYSSITPFASGGQPAQLYEMSKDNIPGGKATAVLVSKFLLFQVSVTLYSLMLIIVRMKHLLLGLKSASGFVFTGLFINTIGLSAIILLAFKPNLLKRVANFIIYKLEKFKLIKNAELKIKKFDHYVSEYLVSINYMKQDVISTIYMFLLTIIQLTAFFSITYFIYKALGLSGTSIIDIVSLQALLYMAVSFIPVPGTVGASEVGFSLLLGSIFSANLVAVALILWRGISYYFGLIFCGIFTFLIYSFDKSRNEKIAS
ncbi:lysylphosphatidylglycerol synthase transmembrane domain-containing protein [Helicovermis profundi]|uniref:Phosphatidylglycerol lysyltransferase n=1 Tax=Helicovermis profundi TaxID=3065157 RepID=A0AAU9E1D6_9FIRM|nr:lysylphosphatidylglycerol synthase transmembrane domain-containing protein [Clostridia bacterium S502]